MPQGGRVIWLPKAGGVDVREQPDDLLLVLWTRDAHVLPHRNA